MANIKYKMGNKLANMSELIKNLENTSSFINGLETSSGFADTLGTNSLLPDPELPITLNSNPDFKITTIDNPLTKYDDVKITFRTKEEFIFTFQKPSKLKEQIYKYLGWKNGLKRLMEIYKVANEKHKATLEKSSAHLDIKANALYNIACYDMIPQLSRIVMSEKEGADLPKILAEWKPTYNWNWLNNAIEVIKKDDGGLNNFWREQVLEMLNLPSGLEALRVQDVAFKIDNQDLYIEILGKEIVKKHFSDCEGLWDRHQDKINVMGQDFKNISLDRDGYLKCSKSRKSRLNIALNKMVNIAKKSGSKAQWFKMIRKGVYKPLFNLKANDMIHALANEKKLDRADYELPKANDLFDSDYADDRQRIGEIGIRNLTERESKGIKDYE